MPLRPTDHYCEPAARRGKPIKSRELLELAVICVVMAVITIIVWVRI